MSSSRGRRGGGHDEGHENSERWLLTYADMITLLLALFIILFSMSTISLKKFVEFKTGLIKSFSQNSIDAILKGSTGVLKNTSLISHPGVTPGPAVPTVGISAGVQTPNPVPTEQQISGQVQQAINALGLQNQVSVTTTQSGVSVQILTDHAFFLTDSATLGSVGYQVVDSLSRIVYSLPNQIDISGYTDNAPIVGGPFSSNIQLSAERAVSVYQRWVLNDGINPARLLATGFGPNDPVAPNTTPANMALNRRVDIVILNPTTASMTQVG